MILTEQQITQREQIFFDLMENIVEDFFDVENLPETIEEDEYMTSVLMDFFVENYREPTLAEASQHAMTGIGVNDQLVESVIDLMLDESIGSFIAGAIHKIKLHKAANELSLAQADAKHHTKLADKAKSKFDTIHSKAVAANKVKTKQNLKTKTPSKGLSGSMAKSYQTAKAQALTKRRDTAHAELKQAKEKRNAAIRASSDAYAKHQDVSSGRERDKLAQHIDTGIANVKHKVTGKIKAGVSKLSAAAHKVAGKAGGLAGKIAGKLA